jgi:hypothetical protein
MHPVLLRNLQGEARENMAAELPTGKEGEGKGVRVWRCDRKETSEGLVPWMTYSS